MATTSMTLGKVWTDWLDEKVESGRYASKSEVVREALRRMQSHEERIEALREDIKAGMDSPSAGPLDMNDVKARARAAWEAAQRAG